MLYMLDNALKHGDNWPELLYGYSWFAKLGTPKNKIKEDRIIDGGGFKVINYSSFRDIIQQAVLEISQKSLGPIEIGALTRHHLNVLKEPTTHDLNKRVSNKNKKARHKAGPPAKVAKPNHPPAVVPQEVAQAPH